MRGGVREEGDEGRMTRRRRRRMRKEEEEKG